MSLRDYFLPVKSIRHILFALQSNSEGLVSEMCASVWEELRDEWGDDTALNEDERNEFQNELSNRTAQLRLFIASDSPPETEQGSWIGVIERIIERERLSVDLAVVFNRGYKHVKYWGLYRSLVDGQLTAAARTMLRHLDVGRPLRGKRIEFDGCLYSWLAIDEIRILYDCLRSTTNDDLKSSDMEDFHADLVDTFHAMLSKECECILIAS